MSLDTIINIVFGVIGAFGTFLGILSLVVAVIQTRRLNEVKIRAQADLVQSIGTCRELIKSITNKNEAVNHAAKTLYEDLIKELVVGVSNFKLKDLRRFRNDGKINEDEYRIGKRFIPPALSFMEKVNQFFTERRSNNTSQKFFFNTVSELGFKDAPLDFPTDLINRGIGKAKKVKISTTWLHNPRMSPFLVDALRKEECEVEILLLDYESDAARQRSFDLNQKDSLWAPGEIKRTLKLLFTLFADNANGKNRIAVYDTAPMFLMYLFDEMIVFSPFFYGDKLACSRRQFVIDGATTELYETMEEQFDIISQRAKTVFPNDTPQSEEYIRRLFKDS